MSYTIAQGDIGSRPREIARDVVASSSTLDDYIFFRSGQYTYTLIIADQPDSVLDFDTMHYTYCSIYMIGEVHVSGLDVYGVYYDYHLAGSRQSGDIHNPNSVLYYSSDPLTPTLIDRGGVYLESSILVAVVVLTAYLIIRDLFAPIVRH